MTLARRQLAAEGPSVSALGLGCMSMSGGYGPADDEEGTATIRRALELGVTFFDTADAYGDGHNERLLTKALGGSRAAVTVATKFGFLPRKDDRSFPISGHPDHVFAACEASLRRLGTDVVDLYYLHRVDPAVPIEETVGAMSELVARGSVRRLGLSEASADTVRRAHAVHPIAAVQTEYSLWSRTPERELLPTLRELGIGFVPYSPLGRGFLAGEIASTADLSDDDWRLRWPRFQGKNAVSNARLVSVLRELAAGLDASPAQLALAWVLAQGDDVVPIPGTRRPAHLEENVAGAGLDIPQDVLAALSASFDAGAVAGPRYPDPLMALVED